MGTVSTEDNTFTGLILLAGEVSPDITTALFTALSPFAVTVIDIEQIIIRERLFLTVLIALNPAHAIAVESDLMECAEELAVDIAISFSEVAYSLLTTKKELVYVTILGNPVKPSMLAALSSEVLHLGGNIEQVSRISSMPNTVLGFVLSEISRTEIQKSLSKLSAEQVIEGLAQNAEMRQARKLVVLDVDSTLIDQEVIELFARRAGAEEEVKDITDAAMRGELDFAQSLAARTALLKGLPETVIEEVQGEIRLTKGARELIVALQKLGHAVALVSGGFIEAIAPLALELGISHVRANSLEIKDGVLTGATTGLLIDSAAKAKALQEFAALEGIPMQHTIAIGDGANDLEMIEIAGIGIAFDAKPILRATADISITERDLTRVLDLLGLPRDI
jgi:phosphoserine phosphatase